MNTKKMYVELFRANDYTQDKKIIFNKTLEYLDNGAIDYCFNNLNLTIAVEQDYIEEGKKLFTQACYDRIDEILSVE